MRNIRRGATLLALVALLAGCSGSAPATSAPALAAATPQASAAASGLPFADEMMGGSQAAPKKGGTYRTRQMVVPFSFTVPDGWGVNGLLNNFVGAEESPTGIPLTQGTVEVIVTAPTSLDPPAPGDQGTAVPADLVGWLQHDPKLTILGAPTDVTIGGVAGKQLEATIPDAATAGTSDHHYWVSDYLVFKAGMHVRFAVLQVGGHAVVVAIASAGADWTAASPAGAAVVASIQWLP